MKRTAQDFSKTDKKHQAMNSRSSPNSKGFTYKENHTYAPHSKTAKNTGPKEKKYVNFKAIIIKLTDDF